MRHLSLAASALAAGTGVAYVGLLIQQGAPVEPFTVLVVIGAIAAMAALTAYGSRVADPARRALALWAAVPGFFGLGFVAGFSIGVFLLIGGLLALPAAIGALRGIELRLVALAWALVILLGWAAVIAMLLIAASSRAAA